ncbi:MAG: DUF6600 domain-containing protein [Dongiaceae bacterium]
MALFSVAFGLASSLAGLPISSALAADDDPPGRVGRLAQIDGTVSFHTADQTTWQAATPNYPITTGNALWADNGAHAIVDVAGNAISLDSDTELDIDHLDDQAFQASVPQGSVYLNVPNVNSGDTYQIATPRGTVNINQPGRYQVITGDQTHPSQVIVYSGAAQVTGDNNLSMAVTPGQMAVLTDDGKNGPVQAALNAAPGEDQFASWVRSQEPRTAPPQAAAAMTGAQGLDRYGQWSTSPDYGSVWYPQVAADWAPYRAGHWAWVGPWGWTWIDDAPWGFAPFHYGRWVQIGPRWAWAPRPVVVVSAPIAPVYAPALVTFFGNIGGVGISIGASVGWIPLAPREVYYPPYRCSDRYARNVNITYVRDVTIINIHDNHNFNFNNFHNHGGVTVVSGDAMTHSRPIAREVRHVDPRDFNGAHGFGGGRPPLHPTAETTGLSPREAQHFGVRPQDIHGEKAAGPQIHEGNREANWNGHNNMARPNQVNNGQRGPNNQPGFNNQHNQGQAALGHNDNAPGNTRWQNRGGSHAPGAPVQRPGEQRPNGQAVNGNNRQPAAGPNASHANGNQANNRNQAVRVNGQSRQPGAAVQPRQNNFQQGNGQRVNNQGQAAQQQRQNRQPSAQRQQQTQQQRAQQQERQQQRQAQPQQQRSAEQQMRRQQHVQQQRKQQERRQPQQERPNPQQNAQPPQQ